MTDDELEQSLQALYRAIDPRHAPQGLRAQIGDALERRPSRPAFTARTRPAFAAALAAVVVVAVGLGLRPGGFLTSPGASPTATSSLQPGSQSPGASPSASQSASPSASPSPTPTPTLALPSGSVPPVSSASWTSLHVVPLVGGPSGQTVSVTTWSGGYLALGQQSDQGPLPAWISHDGRNWVELPAGTFGAAIVALAAPCGDSVVVATQSFAGETTVWHSTDGVNWTSSPSDPMRVNRDSDLAGDHTGAVAILNTSPYRIAFSSDGITWQTVSLPGNSSSSVQGVAAFGAGFVAVGEAGTTPNSPAAWWSADGLHWTAAAVQADPGDAFIDVHAASSGLVAISHDGYVPGRTTFWTSPDGRSWKVSTADPLGVVGPGVAEGAGANGLFVGDGTRLLGYGIRTAGGPTEDWISFDGTHWTRLALTGDTAAASGGDVIPFLLRDGVLFSGFGSFPGLWLGSAEK